jgi:hypothetical protein
MRQRLAIYNSQGEGAILICFRDSPNTADPVAISLSEQLPDILAPADTQLPQGRKTGGVRRVGILAPHRRCQVSAKKGGVSVCF